MTTRFFSTSSSSSPVDGGKPFDLKEFMDDFHSYMTNVRSLKDSKNFQLALSRKYPPKKALAYWLLIGAKVHEQETLHKLIKNMKFLEDLLIHKELSDVDVIPISVISIPKEDFSNLFQKFLYGTEEKRRRLLQNITKKHGTKVHDGFIWRMIRVLYDMHPHDHS